MRDADGREVQRAAELLRAPLDGPHGVVERFVRRPDLGRVEAVGGQRRGRGGLVVVKRRAVEVAVAGVDRGLHARAGLVLRDEIKTKSDLGHGRAIVERERQGAIGFVGLAGAAKHRVHSVWTAVAVRRSVNVAVNLPSARRV